jgi:type I restriction enzyme S subunit
MSGSLPQGWVETTIGAVTTSPAQRQPNVDETFFYIDISSIDRDTKRIENPQQLIGKDAPSRARKVIAAGDVLVSMTRPNLNAVALVPGELDGQIASTGFDVLRPNGVDPRWLFYIVRSADFVAAMTDLVQGALYPAVKSSDVRSYRIQLPPFAEQQRIADTLDRLLARVDASRARLARVPALLKRFRQAVLAAAVAGRLTEDWREENEVASSTTGLHTLSISKISAIPLMCHPLPNNTKSSAASKPSSPTPTGWRRASPRPRPASRSSRRVCWSKAFRGELGTTTTDGDGNG